MRKLLYRIFIRDYDNVKDPKVRENYGKMAGMVGIVTNLFLSVSKFITGYLFNSIAIMADSVNNITDTTSSVITLFGFKLSAKPEDEEHPYGHARFEYLTGLVVSLLIMILGLKLLATSFDKVLHPEPVEFSLIAVAVLLVAIGIKVWQSIFNIKTGELIQSVTLKATGIDSRNDVIVTSAILACVFIEKFTGLHLDGWMGCIVALFVIWSGFLLIKETSSPLLGKAPEPELVREIETRITSQSGVLGIHDLVVHDYGPGRIFASVHVEVDAKGDLIASHDMIDNIERSISRDLKLHLVVHMDPLETEDPLTIKLNDKISEILTSLDGVVGFHDLRVVAGYTHSNVVFDVVVSPGCKLTQADITKHVEDQLQLLDKTYYATITFDQSYVQNNI